MGERGEGHFILLIVLQFVSREDVKAKITLSYRQL